MTEQWRPVVGFDDYWVSDHGSVMSYRRTPKCLKPDTFPQGHQRVTLALDGRYLRRWVHRLVLEAFMGPCPPGMEGCHNDGDATNNKISNLRWDTHVNNCADQREHGTISAGTRHGRHTMPHRTARGSNHGCAKLTETQVFWIKRAIDAGWQGIVIAEKFKTTSSAVSRIKQGKSWAHVE